MAVLIALGYAAWRANRQETGPLGKTGLPIPGIPVPTHATD